MKGKQCDIDQVVSLEVIWSGSTLFANARVIVFYRIGVNMYITKY